MGATGTFVLLRRFAMPMLPSRQVVSCICTVPGDAAAFAAGAGGGKVNAVPPPWPAAASSSSGGTVCGQPSGRLAIGNAPLPSALICTYKASICACPDALGPQSWVHCGWSFITGLQIQCAHVRTPALADLTGYAKVPRPRVRDADLQWTQQELLDRVARRMQHAPQRGRRAGRFEADHILDEDVLWLSLRMDSMIIMPSQ